MILYSFRRCPYAIRARLALAYALPSASLELREVVLKNKPNAMLKLSPKGTVPVLLLSNHSPTSNGQVIDESLDIMYWALKQSDKDNWLDNSNKEETTKLIQQNDHNFKWALDHYKYADRHEHSAEYYRNLAMPFLQLLEKKLQNQRFLEGDSIALADAAIFPFVRQFAHVDKNWFFASEYRALIKWLNDWLESDIFQSIMKKNAPWKPENTKLYFP